MGHIREFAPAVWRRGIHPRGIRFYGDADVVTKQGGYMDQTGHSEHHYIRIHSIKKWSWGIDEPVFVDGKYNVKRETNGS